MISIVIPTHNRPELLRRAIASVLNQTYPDLELIVVDDGSQPSAQSIADALHDPRIQFIRHEVSRGGGAARNTGIRRAKGDYIAFLDDDDEWLPEKLAVQMKRFAATGPEVGFCFSAVTNIYDDHREDSSVVDGIEDHFVRALGNPKGYLTVTLVFKRAVFDRVGLFDEALPSHQEADLIIRTAKQFKGLGINQPLVKVNMRSSHDRVGRSVERRIAGREMLIKKHLADLQKYPHELAWHYFQLGLWYRDSGNVTRAREYFWHAFRTRPAMRFILHAIKTFLRS